MNCCFGELRERVYAKIMLLARRLLSLFLRRLLCWGVNDDSEEGMDGNYDRASICSSSLLGFIQLERWERSHGDCDSDNGGRWCEANEMARSPKGPRVCFAKFQPNLDIIIESCLELLELLN